MSEYVGDFMSEECGTRIVETCCEGEDSFFCAEIAETEHGSIAVEERERLVVELGLEIGDHGSGICWEERERWGWIDRCVCTVN